MVNIRRQRFTKLTLKRVCKFKKNYIQFIYIGVAKSERPSSTLLVHLQLEISFTRGHSDFANGNDRGAGAAVQKNAGRCARQG